MDQSLRGGTSSVTGLEHFLWKHYAYPALNSRFVLSILIVVLLLLLS